MWDAFTRLAGYQLAESLAASSVYEISVGPLSKHANSTIQNSTMFGGIAGFIGQALEFMILLAKI